MVATSGPGWHLAPCLVALFDEADRRDPTRDKSSDGSIGNSEHAARLSDHNPDDGWVTAGDIDDDSDDQRLNVQLLRQHLVASRNPRVKYLIHERTIWKAYPNRGLPAWTPQVYSGLNAHKDHLHISVWNTAEARNDTGPWWPQEDDMSEALDKLNAIELRIIDLEKKVTNIFERQVPEETVRADITLNRQIAVKVGVPDDQIPK